MSTSHHWGSVAFNWKQFYSERSNTFLYNEFTNNFFLLRIPWDDELNFLAGDDIFVSASLKDGLGVIL